MTHFLLMSLAHLLMPIPRVYYVHPQSIVHVFFVVVVVWWCPIMYIAAAIKCMVAGISGV